MSNRIQVPPDPAEQLKRFMRKAGLSRGEVARLLFDGTPADQSQSVAVAYVHDHDVSYSWHHSAERLRTWDLFNEGRVWDGGYVAMKGGTDGLAHARNVAVRDFLADRQADWLWWVDTDMGFDPDTVDRLMEVADPIERPVVGALCFAQRENELDGMGGHLPVAWPTVMDYTNVGGSTGFAVRWDYPRDRVTRCTGTGSACILIHRTVFERVRDEYAARTPGWMGWYSRVTNPSSGELVSEDLSFCSRLMQLDIPVHVHTGVKTTHHKSTWLNEDDYWRARALDAMLQKAAHPHPYVPGVAGEEYDSELLSVLIPYRAPEGSHRARLKAYTENLWRQLPGVELIYADDGLDGEFNVARAFNRARAMATGKKLLTVGADHLPPTVDRLRWVKMLLDSTAWTGVFEATDQFTEQATEEILAGADSADKDVTTVPACQGIIAVRADAWDEAGGMDERFGTRWGFEDTALREVLQALFPDGDGRGDGAVQTLWHPPRDGATMGGPNAALYTEYERAAREGRMRDYLASRP